VERGGDGFWRLKDVEKGLLVETAVGDGPSGLVRDDGVDPELAPRAPRGLESNDPARGGEAGLLK
jgi:hypothetical protein